MTGRPRTCGRDPDAGPGSCRLWWEGCGHPKAPPSSCFHAWANQHPGDPYAWRDPWIDPRTLEYWPAPPFIGPIDSVSVVP